MTDPGRQPAPTQAASPRADLAATLRRVVVGFRVVGALWLTLLTAVVLATGDADPTVAWGTIALVLGWTAGTVALARRGARRGPRPEASPGVAVGWSWVLADVAVGAGTVVAAGLGGVRPGGFPLSSVAVAVLGRGLAGGLVAAGLLAAVAVAVPVVVPMVDGVAVVAAVETVVFYLASGAVLGWTAATLLRSDARRRAAEAALADERAERVRSQERAETAAHLHDSVLQTLALIQRRGGDAVEVAALARRQERELRDWLAGGRGTAGGSFAAALADVAEEVEATHRIGVDLVTAGDAPLDERLAALVAAAREALVNAAKHAGVDRVAVYAEAGGAAGGAGGTSMVFVRDRGRGFDPGAVGVDRRGIRESIVGRVEQQGGRVTIRAAPGAGTEVELALPPPGAPPTAPGGAGVPSSRG